MNIPKPYDVDPKEYLLSLCDDLLKKNPNYNHLDLLTYILIRNCCYLNTAIITNCPEYASFITLQYNQDFLKVIDLYPFLSKESVWYEPDGSLTLIFSSSSYIALRNGSKYKHDFPIGENGLTKDTFAKEAIKFINFAYSIISEDKI